MRRGSIFCVFSLDVWAICDGRGNCKAGGVGRYLGAWSSIFIGTNLSVRARADSVGFRHQGDVLQLG